MSFGLPLAADDAQMHGSEQLPMPTDLEASEMSAFGGGSVPDQSPRMALPSIGGMAAQDAFPMHMQMQAQMHVQAQAQAAAAAHAQTQAYAQGQRRDSFGEAPFGGFDGLPQMQTDSLAMAEQPDHDQDAFTHAHTHADTDGTDAHAHAQAYAQAQTQMPTYTQTQTHAPLDGSLHPADDRYGDLSSTVRALPRSTHTAMALGSDEDTHFAFKPKLEPTDTDAHTHAKNGTDAMFGSLPQPVFRVETNHPSFEACAVTSTCTMCRQVEQHPVSTAKLQVCLSFSFVFLFSSLCVVSVLCISVCFPLCYVSVF